MTGPEMHPTESDHIDYARAAAQDHADYLAAGGDNVHYAGESPWGEFRTNIMFKGCSINGHPIADGNFYTGALPDGGPFPAEDQDYMPDRALATGPRAPAGTDALYAGGTLILLRGPLLALVVLDARTQLDAARGSGTLFGPRQHGADQAEAQWRRSNPGLSRLLDLDQSGR